jgi:hypothetical protein
MAHTWFLSPPGAFASPMGADNVQQNLGVEAGFGKVSEFLSRF